MKPGVAGRSQASTATKVSVINTTCALAAIQILIAVSVERRCMLSIPPRFHTTCALQVYYKMLPLASEISSLPSHSALLKGKVRERRVRFLSGSELVEFVPSILTYSSINASVKLGRL